MQAKYVIVSKKNRTIRSFEDAGAVAAFMWGRDFNDWCIFQRQDGLPCDVVACKDVLTARERVCHNVSGEPVIRMGESPVFPDGAK